MTASPFELDIAAQAGALRAFAGSPVPRCPGPVRYERIVLTGMGSSHFAALPTWRSLVAQGHSVWWLDSGRLLDTARLVTTETLLVVTSQSGASGEVTALLGPSSTITRPRRIIGVTNDLSSPLARHADVVIGLYSGAEATVSTKSYLNTLAAHQRLLRAVTGRGADTAHEVADLAERFEPGGALTELARATLTADNPRIAMIGNQDHAATALYAGLITKEAAKVAAEGYIGGQFRHGPLELAGPGLTALLFGVFGGNRSMRRLGSDLVRSGAHVLLVGDVRLDGAETIVIPRGDTLVELAAGALVAQRFAVELAKARGIEPGAFTYGNKVTTSL